MLFHNYLKNINSFKLEFKTSVPTNLTFKNRTFNKPTRINQFRLSKRFILNILHNHIIDYPTPKDLN